MAGKYLSYAEYKDSGVEWLGEIPDHWNISKLKFLADIQPSNIDKKTKDGEIPVMLCNYTDVYYNDEADESINYMRASATDEQIEKFTLKAGDTIITKDSEDPSDIAVPAFVPNDLPGVVCGYHLAMIRPKNCNYGAYVKRVFESDYAQAYFETRANGLTRYGLGTYPLCNAYYPNPTESEAITIANFLDHETAKIDTLIAKQQQLIKLLKEKRQAVISHAVTKGLNPEASMKDSGVEWLGEVPKHWKVARLKNTSNIIDCRNKTPEYFENGEYLVIRTTNVKKQKLNLEGALYTDEVNFKIWTQRGVPPSGSILFTREAPAGEICMVPENIKFCMGQRMMNFVCHNQKYTKYLFDFLLSDCLERYIESVSHGSTVSHLRVEQVENIPVLVPPCEEIIEIHNELLEIKTKYLKLTEKAEIAIALMKERRTALISDAVTGKIDVRNWKLEKVNPENAGSL